MLQFDFRDASCFFSSNVSDRRRQAMLSTAALAPRFVVGHAGSSFVREPQFDHRSPAHCTASLPSIQSSIAATVLAHPGIAASKRGGDKIRRGEVKGLPDRVPIADAGHQTARMTI
jgi:hypothetical protein